MPRRRQVPAAWMAVVVAGLLAGCAGVDAVPVTFGDLPSERRALVEDAAAAHFRLTISAGGNSESRDIDRAAASTARVHGGKDADGAAFLRIELLDHFTMPPGTVVYGRATGDDDTAAFTDDEGNRLPDEVVAQAISAITLSWFPQPTELSGRTLNPGDEIEMADQESAAAMPGSMTRPRWTSRVVTYRGVQTRGEPAADWAVFDVRMVGEIDAAFDGDANLRGLQVRGPVRATGRVYVRVDDPGIRDGRLQFPVQLDGAGVMAGQSFTCEVDGRMTRTYKSSQDTDESDTADGATD